MTLEKMQERAREKYVETVPINYEVLKSNFTPDELNSLITEVWNEAIKECVEIAKEEERHAVGLLALVPQTIVRRLEGLPKPNITSDKTDV